MVGDGAQWIQLWFWCHASGSTSVFPLICGSFCFRMIIIVVDKEEVVGMRPQRDCYLSGRVFAGAQNDVLLLCGETKQKTRKKNRKEKRCSSILFGVQYDVMWFNHGFNHVLTESELLITINASKSIVTSLLRHCWACLIVRVASCLRSQHTQTLCTTCPYSWNHFYRLPIIPSLYCILVLWWPMSRKPYCILL